MLLHLEFSLLSAQDEFGGPGVRCYRHGGIVCSARDPDRFGVPHRLSFATLLRHLPGSAVPFCHRFVRRLMYAWQGDHSLRAGGHCRFCLSFAPQRSKAVAESLSELWSSPENSHSRQGLLLDCVSILAPFSGPCTALLGHGSKPATDEKWDCKSILRDLLDTAVHHRTRTTSQGFPGPGDFLGAVTTLTG